MVCPPSARAALRRDWLRSVESEQETAEIRAHFVERLANILQRSVTSAFGEGIWPAHQAARSIGVRKDHLAAALRQLGHRLSDLLWGRVANIAQRERT